MSVVIGLIFCSGGYAYWSKDIEVRADIKVVEPEVEQPETDESKALSTGQEGTEQSVEKSEAHAIDKDNADSDEAKHKSPS
ncbi:hypothetical protein LCM20_14225 [Halobacillus litoralis]|uniref:hypothetical protein n=1 Tax=Halobacillus litoralis TaxID=45668 RepID=UPI001CD3E0F4|nr:hypothetical protein [Halobacillus litoralis]MCA0971760.1 hypothetical protein [Halobacillus litoralis]